jgi:hypothetical protein
MENNTTPLKIGLRYGLIVGLVMIIYSIILNVTGLNLNPAMGYMSYVILIIFIFLAHNTFKKEGDGYMSIGQGLGIGMITSSIGGVLSSVFSTIYITIIDPSILDKIKDMQIEKMEEQGIDEATIQKSLEMAEWFMSPIGLFISGLVGILFVGFVISLIISLITKKDNPQTEI